MTREVAAAGGVVWRSGDAGRREVVLVYRPRHDDWSLPKGKVDPGEHPLHAAVREVREETGLCAVPQARLPTVTYSTRRGARKRVDYWVMRCAQDLGREPDDEVREARWVPEPDAGALLSYQRDRDLLAAFAELPPVDGELALVRHAYAGQRSPGAAPAVDAARRLDGTGRRDAVALCALLDLLRPARVVSASPVRCVDTVRPMGRPVRVDNAFDEVSPAGVAGALEALRALIRQPAATVVCSQGGMIPRVLAALDGDGRFRTEAGYVTRMGTGWLLAFTGAQLTGADPIVP